MKAEIECLKNVRNVLYLMPYDADIFWARKSLDKIISVLEDKIKMDALGICGQDIIDTMPPKPEDTGGR